MHFVGELRLKLKTDPACDDPIVQWPPYKYPFNGDDMARAMSTYTSPEILDIIDRVRYSMIQLPSQTGSISPPKHQNLTNVLS